MPDFDMRTRETSAVRRALAMIQDLEARLVAAEQAAHAPVAVIGLGCRFPGGVADDAGFWRLLRDGQDGIGEVPPERWDVAAYYDPDPDRPGKTNARWGGFLADVDAFDASLFGISRREAEAMDPQHRLLLELTWQALEHAGLAPDSLTASRTGVYVGLSTADYATAMGAGRDASWIDALCQPRQCPQYRRGPFILCVRTSGTGHGGRHRVLVVAHRGAPGGAGTAGRRVRAGARLRRQSDADARAYDQFHQGSDAGGGRAVQDVRCVG